MRRTYLFSLGLIAVLAMTAACQSASPNEGASSSSSVDSSASSVESSAPDGSSASSDVSSSVATSGDDIVAEAKAAVKEATKALTGAAIPQDSPPMQKDKFVILIPCAQAGEGCAQPAEGSRDAAEAAGWKAQIIDGQGTAEGQSAAINQAISLKPDGIITYAIDPEGVIGAIQAARAAGIKVVASSAAPSDKVDFGGIPTADSWRDGGVMDANYVIAQTDGQARSIILTGNEFAALIPRSEGYESRLSDCAGCSVSAKENFAFADMATSLPQLVQQLVQRDPKVNSIYVVYDAAVPYVLQGLKSLGRSDIVVVSGDGTSETLQCLRDECGQSATAALPLRWLGWADVDIMNRLFAGVDPQSAADALPIKLITSDNVQSEPGNWGGDVDFEAAYKKLWQVG